VAPAGHVYSFEFNLVRAQAAATEVLEHGLAHLCTVDPKPGSTLNPTP